MKPPTIRACGRLFSLILLAPLGGGCSVFTSYDSPTPEKEFILYWPPAGDDGKLRVAVKDLIDMKGHVTSAGSQYFARKSVPAVRDAEVLGIARERGVRFVGKTNLTEFAITVSGTNDYFGTPVNFWDDEHKAIPGGSSSGSAVAVATDRADVAIGTDTGGSIRVPAAFCGIYGLKTTFGLVPTKGVFPISPEHLDTVGPMAADVPRLVEGMSLMQRDFKARYRRAVAAEPTARGIRIGRLYIPGTDPEIDRAIDSALEAEGFQVVKLSGDFLEKWRQADADGATVALGDIWRYDQEFQIRPFVSRVTRLVIARGSLESTRAYDDAIARKAGWQRELRRAFRRVDFIATPTVKILPPSRPIFGSSAIFEQLVFNSQNTVGVNLAGNPAIAIPIEMPSEDGTEPVTSLQLIGPWYSEAGLVNAARLLASEPRP